MSYKIHSNARTTPAVRKEIHASPLGPVALADKFNISRLTARKWKSRDSVEDRSHRPHTLHTTLSPLEEEVVVALRTILLLPLDDLLAVTKAFINEKVSRSGLDRCLRRHGVSRLKDLIPQEVEEKRIVKTFKDYAPGFVHVDVKYLPQMPDQTHRSYLFVGIDRATRWVYLEILPDKGADNAQQFLTRLIDKAPFKIEKVLTDNGKEFTDRFCATGQRKPTGKHLFDKVCSDHSIEHRLTQSRSPQTNGMVERFNGRISEVVKQTRFESIAELKETLLRYMAIYNHHIPQKALSHQSPIEAMKLWQKKTPHAIGHGERMRGPIVPDRQRRLPFRS